MKLYKALLNSLEGRESMAVATVIEDTACGGKLLGSKARLAGSEYFSDIGEPLFDSKIEQLLRDTINKSLFQLCHLECVEGSVTVMVECLHPVADLIILGGGHISLPLARIAALLQYSVTVVDDRPAFANKQRFPEAAAVICDDFLKALNRLQIGRNTSVVIVTRGHHHDRLCLEYILNCDTGYTGMIGSRKRVKALRELLFSQGYSEEKLSRVHMPIGLPINAETPEEIALSIAAQLVAVHRSGEHEHSLLSSKGLDWKLMTQYLEHLNSGKPLAAATIIRSMGSTPRKPGAKMLVEPDGSCLGTIGGGCVEAEVRREALTLFDVAGTGTGRVKLHKVTLDDAMAAEEGMVCGGRMEVFLERLV